jgi:O-antigen/teichoic acid export membrane protein
MEPPHISDSHAGQQQSMTKKTSSVESKETSQKKRGEWWRFAPSDLAYKFKRDDVTKELKRKTARGLVSRFAANGISAFLTMASTIVLARLLTPEEFGLFAMVAAVMEFARSFREVGLGTATVQRETIFHEEVSMLFWVNLGIGGGTMIAMAALAPAIVWFYGDPGLFNICVVSSTVFLFAGLTVQHRALLERQMKFVHLGAIYVVATILSIAVAISFAFYGLSVWALVWRDVSFAGIYAVGTWAFCRWVPGLPKKDVSIRPMVAFGAEVTGFDILQYFSRNADRLLIGRFWGACDLGFYTKAMQVVMVPVEHLRMTMLGLGLSPLSALKSNGDRYRRFFCKLLSVFAFMYMPMVVFVGLEADTLVRVLLGERWVSAAPLVQVFSIAAFVRPISSACHLVMVSWGMTRRYLIVGAINSGCMIASFGVGLRWGSIGVAYGYCLASLCLLTWELRYCLNETPISWILVVRGVAMPVLASLGAGIVSIVVMAHINEASSGRSVIYSLIVIVLAYLAIWLVVPNGRRELWEFWSYRQELFSKSLS